MKVKEVPLRKPKRTREQIKQDAEIRAKDRIRAKAIRDRERYIEAEARRKKKREKRNAKLQVKRDEKRAAIADGTYVPPPPPPETDEQKRQRLITEIVTRRRALELALYTKSFAAFAKAAWPLIDPAPLQWSWHHEALADLLQNVTLGHIKNLLINIAPRHTKSSLLSVLWPAWEWSLNPGQTWFYCSFSYDLAMRDSAQCRRLVESPWYRRFWGDKVKLVEDANQIERYKTTGGGHRISGSPGGRGMGDGGNRCIIDDPHAAEDDGAKMEAVWNWYTGTFFNRMSDPKLGARVICGQRLAMRDLFGRILEVGGYTHFYFQEEYDPSNRCVISTPSFTWDKDPRKEAGEPLWPTRYGPAEIEDLKRNTPATQYSARYQQRPIPAGGFQFKREWFKYFTELGSGDGPMYVLGNKLVPVKSCRRIAVVDPACTAKKVGSRPCYTVVGIFAVTPDNDLLLLHVYRKQEESPTVVADLGMLMSTFALPFFWVEKNGIGVPTIQFCLKAGIPVRDIPATLSKNDRAQAAEIWMGNGKVFFPKGVSWLPALEREIETFPQSDYKDQVDVLAHACGLMRGVGQSNTGRGSGVISFSGNTGSAIGVYRAG